MNINLKYLLLGTSLSLIPQYAVAQCAETNCLKLGYTKLEKCDNGLKCPFGEYWACPCDNSYQYACTDTNERPGTDKCGEKYKSCNCAYGFEWKDGKCQTKGAVFGECSGYAYNCKIGDILNSDGTCTTSKTAGKTPIAVVAYISNDGKCGQAIALAAIGRYKWSTEIIDTGVTQSKDAKIIIKDFDSCGNTKKITQVNNYSYKTYPAAWEALNYAPDSILSTKGKWCLPAAGILYNIEKNWSKIDNAISEAGGVEIFSDPYHWSSSEADYNGAWYKCSYGGTCANGLSDGFKSNKENVRPVIEF